MKTLFPLLLGAVLFGSGWLHAQGTAFTYQGSLMNSNSAANGVYVMAFTLYNQLAGGSVVGAPVTVNPVIVTNGLFSVGLDFGPAAFTGGDRCLEIAVTSPGNDQPVVVLQPRQPITRTPYALHAYTAGDVSSFANAPLDIKVDGARALRLQRSSPNSDSINVIGGWYGNSVASGVSGATVAGGGGDDPLLGALSPNRVDADFGTVGGGVGNIVATGSQHATIAGGAHNTIQANANYAAISGGRDNTVLSFAQYATIGGGNGNAIHSYSIFATIGGGIFNTIERFAYYATIGAGLQNILRSNATFSLIAGGFGNTVEGGSDFATIAGGSGNVIQGDGDFGVVAGGRDNTAGRFAFAAGTRAKARHTGTFVWGDSTDSNVSSTNENSVTMRASGGYILYSDDEASTGVYLEPGGGSWATMSDENRKTNFANVDSAEVLEKIAAMPMRTWNYKSQDAGVRHMGPTAQDFHAAFGLGSDDKHIVGVDADGVALAALQGLNRKLEKALQEKEAEIRALQNSVTELKALVDRLARSMPNQ